MKLTTINELSKHIKQSLKGIYPDREIKSFIELIFEKKVNLKKTKRLLNPEYKLDNQTTQEIFRITEQLKKSVPIQYLLGETYFYDLPFTVNKNVLIPRQETEELVDWIIHEQQGADKILDIGTGSGCIAIALAKNIPAASLYATDFDDSIIEVAKQNAKKNAVSIQFLKSNILQEKPHIEKLDVIVSNPPYVLESEKQYMHKNVLDFEPQKSLFVPDSNALIFYHKIAEYSAQYLENSGALYLEINENKAKETADLLKGYKFRKITIKKDINEKPRMIKAEKNE
ncbi:MAG: peptide chain release factor N(5)-glutamine methyltransferase [Bacteroidales bacterium]